MDLVDRRHAGRVGGGHRREEAGRDALGRVLGRDRPDHDATAVAKRAPRLAERGVRLTHLVENERKDHAVERSDGDRKLLRVSDDPLDGSPGGFRRRPRVVDESRRDVAAGHVRADRRRDLAREPARPATNIENAGGRPDLSRPDKERHPVAQVRDGEAGVEMLYRELAGPEGCGVNPAICMS